MAGEQAHREPREFRDREKTEFTGNRRIPFGRQPNVRGAVARGAPQLSFHLAARASCRRPSARPGRRDRPRHREVRAA